MLLLFMLKQMLTEFNFDAISIMKNSNLVDKKGVFSFFLLCIKNEGFDLLSEKQRRDTK